MAKCARLVVELNVEFVPISQGEIMSWRAGVSLLLQLLKEEKMLCTVHPHWVVGYDVWQQVRSAVELME